MKHQNQWISRALPLALVLVAAHLAAGAAWAQTTIDFDDLADGALVGANYDALGVNFVDAKVLQVGPGSGLPGWPPEGYTQPNTILHTTSGSLGILPEDPIEAIFSCPVSSVSILGLDVGSNGMQLLAYDAQDNLIASDSWDPSPCSDLNCGEGYGVPVTLSVSGSIARVEFSQIRFVCANAAECEEISPYWQQSGDGMVFDNLTFVEGEDCPSADPQPWECTGEAFLIQESPQASLYQVDRSSEPFDFIPLFGPISIPDIPYLGGDEINNLAFNREDNFLYGWRRDPSPGPPFGGVGPFYKTGQGGIVRIGSNGVVEDLGPNGLPTSVAEGLHDIGKFGSSFDAGDFALDGSEMYFNYDGAWEIWTVPFDLATGSFNGAATSSQLITLVSDDGGATTPLDCTITSSFVYTCGRVSDWAVSPIDGLLYGGDDTDGQVAQVDPATGDRTDVTVLGCSPATATCPASVTGLPTNPGYGAAWMDDEGDLWLSRNNGELYEVTDVGTDTPRIVTVQLGGPSSAFNDGAACIPDIPDLALTVSKNADTAIARTYTWSIDKTANFSELTLMPGQTIQVEYEVEVSAMPSDVNSVSGLITIANNTAEDATIASVTDEISGDPTTPAAVDCQVDYPYELGSALEFVCTYGAVLPDTSSQTNTATVTTTAESLVGGGTATAAVDFTNATLTEIDECIDVYDDKGGETPIYLGMVCADAAPKTFTYYLDFGPFSDPDDCGQLEAFVNTARFETGDQGLEGSADWTIPITVDCEDGCSLTPGYWKTHSEYGPAPYDDTWALLEFEADTPFFLSGQSYYEVLWTEPQGDAYYILAHAYIAAQLNFLNGADPTAAQAAFDEATALFAQYEPAEVSGAKGKNGKELREQFIDLATTLDNYNNGYIGPGHCSEEDVYMVPGGGGSSLHVGDLDASASTAKRSRWNANVTITVHDESDGALADATVSGEWSDGSSGSCFTNNSGQCAIDRNNIRSGDSITFTVTDVTHGAFTYAAADNHDPDGDSDGTSIDVMKP